jgi:hypothetical protein
MATATAAGVKAGKREEFSVLTPQSTCRRCGGLLVSDFCMDLLNSTGELEFATKRCVQCGDVVDPVILNHRIAKQRAGSRRGVTVSGI